MTRILGVDYGERRVGIALSDPTGTIASPLTTLPNDGRLLASFRNIVEDQNVAEMVVGEPRTMKGEVGKRAEEARLFAARLRESFSLPVTLWDERLTSVRAHQSMLEMGMKKKQRAEKSSVDQIAAALLLQNYLDAARIRSQREALKRSGEGTEL